MQTARYYRDYAKRARRLRDSVDRRSINETLETLARGFDEIASALETGAIRTPDLDRQPRRAFSERNDQSAIVEPLHGYASMTRH